MDRDVAREVASRVLAITTAASASVRRIMAQETIDTSRRYSHFVGDVLGKAYERLLAPIWREHPDLEPVAAPASARSSALTPESQAAINDVLNRARAELEALEQLLAQEDGATSAEPLKELRSAIEALARFRDDRFTPR